MDSCNSRERRERIFDEHGNVQQNISIFRNGRKILFLKVLETELDAKDSIEIFPQRPVADIKHGRK